MASFSPYRSLRWTHDTGRSSPASASRSLANRETGWNGSSLISEWATTGSHSSSRPDQGSDDPGLGLTPLTEQDHVVPGQDGVLQLGQDGVLEARAPRSPEVGRRRSAPRRCVGSPRATGIERQPDLAQPTERGDVRRRGEPGGQVQARPGCVLGFAVLRSRHGPSLRGTIHAWSVGREARAGRPLAPIRPTASPGPRPPNAQDPVVSHQGGRNGKMRGRQRSRPLGRRVARPRRAGRTGRRTARRRNGPGERHGPNGQEQGETT